MTNDSTDQSIFSLVDPAQRGRHVWRSTPLPTTTRPIQRLRHCIESWLDDLDFARWLFALCMTASVLLIRRRLRSNGDEPLLTEFENALSEIYFRSRGDLGVIVFSDHGNTETPSRAVAVETFLAKRGWHIRESVKGPRDVAIPSYGLVAFAAIYCQPEAIETIAEELRGIEGADVIVSRDPDGNDHGRADLKAVIRAAGSAATAELAWSLDGRRYRYAALNGDPLGLVPVFDSLRAAGKLDADGFASDADLFAATSLGAFPDAAAHIRAWTMNQVRNPADVLISLKPGYYHGIESFRHIVNLAGTHGGLERSGSLGFAMATYPLAPATRLSDLIPAKLLQRGENAQFVRRNRSPEPRPPEQSPVCDSGAARPDGGTMVPNPRRQSIPRV